MNSAPSNRAIFLDRDGTLNVNTHYLIDFADFRPMPGAVEGLRLLKEKGYRFFVATNQSGVARGFFSAARVEALHRNIGDYFRSEGIEIEEFAYCPHHPEGVVAEYRRVCGCRKPKPGMVLDLARRHGIDVRASYMVGDMEGDVACGEAAGARGVLIRPKNHGPEIADRVHLEGFETLLDFARCLSD